MVASSGTKNRASGGAVAREPSAHDLGDGVGVDGTGVAQLLGQPTDGSFVSQRLDLELAEPGHDPSPLEDGDLVVGHLRKFVVPIGQSPASPFRAERGHRVQFRRSRVRRDERPSLCRRVPAQPIEMKLIAAELAVVRPGRKLECPTRNVLFAGAVAECHAVARKPQVRRVEIGRTHIEIGQRGDFQRSPVERERRQREAAWQCELQLAFPHRSVAARCAASISDS